MKVNRDNWDERVPIHARSSTYDLEGFKEGKSSLHSTEIEEVGDVKGKKMLHLQCHFGLDTLSWARMGAKITGMDFSEEAINLARSLAKELNLGVEFVVSNLYDLRENLKGQFDIVYTSYGVLCWLPDIKEWAKIIAHFLKQGGFFYIVEDHPVSMMYEEEIDGKLEVTYPYFHKPDPLKFDQKETYAGEEKLEKNTMTYEWNHHFSEIICSLIDAGLSIEHVHEFPHCCWQRFPMMKEDDQGKWWLPDEMRKKLPMTYSLKASKREQ